MMRYRYNKKIYTLSALEYEWETIDTDQSFIDWKYQMLRRGTIKQLDDENDILELFVSALTRNDPDGTWDEVQTLDELHAGLVAAADGSEPNDYYQMMLDKLEAEMAGRGL